MWATRAAVWLLLFLGGTTSLSAGPKESAPLSAIDWLSRSVSEPANPAAQPKGKRIKPTDIASTALPSPITSAPLSAVPLDSIGLVPAAKSGLPANLWGASRVSELVTQIRGDRNDALPAVQALLYSVLVAELDPPIEADPRGDVFLARVDKLLDLGALDPAMALVTEVDDPPPEVFRRGFDIALLTGEEDRACTLMLGSPGIAPTFPARIFCLARDGDWNAAALTLRIGESLGHIDAENSALLERFLDPELADGEPDLPIPARPSPLVLRLMEAIGQPLSTESLPVAFAQADLRSNAGWKARLDAGERLARTGAVDANRLLGLYTEARPAASGGVWERVRAIQTLDAATTAGDRAAVARALPAAWEAMKAAELEVPFAALYGEELARLKLDGAAGATAFRIGLLSGAFETVAKDRAAADDSERFLIGLATGKSAGTTAGDQMGVAVAAAFAGPAPGRDAASLPDYAELVAGRRAGEALLKAIDEITNGARGDLRDVTEGLSYLRAAGLETEARQAALELVLLERRG